MYDLIIIGGGPASIAAGVYASRKKIKALLIADSFGGQSTVSTVIENFIGIPSISGTELAKKFEDHLRALKNIEILDFERVLKTEKKTDGFLVSTESGKSYEARTVLITTGSRQRKLGVVGEDKFEGKGVAYCATCDAPLFKDKTVAVVGGGNAGLEAVIDLLPYAKEIYLLEFSDAIRGDAITFEKIKKETKVKIMTMAQVLEVLGKEMVTAIKYKDRKTNETKELKLDGVFVEIGWEPNSDLVKDLVKLSERKEIIVNHQTQASSLEGIWAAGDVTDCLYKQINTSIGDSIKAALNIYDYLKLK